MIQDPSPSSAVIGDRHPLSGAFSPVDQQAWGELSARLGVSRSGELTTIAVHSSRATHVLLEIYQRPMREPARFDYFMQRGADGVFRAQLADVPEGTLYGFRAWGSNWALSPEWRRGNSSAGFVSDVDDLGNRFNPNKLLFDPYARELSHDRQPLAMELAGHHAGMYGSGGGTYAGFEHAGWIRREFDTGAWAPKSVVLYDEGGHGDKPQIAEKDLVIYEVHPRGFTRHPSAERLGKIVRGIPGFEGVGSVPRELCGTYLGAARAAKYLKALGFNAIELLPVHESAAPPCPDGAHESDQGRGLVSPGTHWGYMTYGYFAPARRYAHDRSLGGPTREFKQMVRAFHDEGMAVLLDVVYNHSGEGGVWQGDVDTAELLFLRGLDNATYYALLPDGRRYWESTGCGNNLDCSRPIVQALILDSLRYWARELGVDGFRFDLATVLGRDAASGYRFELDAELLVSIERLARQERFIAIAEAWDAGDGGYQVGRFPPGWSEWNGVYRDAVRRFLRGDEGQLFAFIEVVNGDRRDFAAHGGPHKSVNFVTAHDGFSLMDLVSYDRKNNREPWPFGPSDGGSDDNDSWDSGGDHALRRQRLRNFFVVLSFSRGVPMVRAGDELGQTLNGNNNPYQLDSAPTWLNYAMIATHAPNRVPTGSGAARYHDNYGLDGAAGPTNGLFLFVRYLLHLRAAHDCLRQDKFADRADEADSVVHAFTQEDGKSPLEGWERSLCWRIRANELHGSDFLILVNMQNRSAEFRLPASTPDRAWRRLIDTAEWAEVVGNLFVGPETFLVGSFYGLHRFSMAVFVQAT
jgi:glycogen operon protein